MSNSSDPAPTTGGRTGRKASGRSRYVLTMSRGRLSLLVRASTEYREDNVLAARNCSTLAPAISDAVSSYIVPHPWSAEGSLGVDILHLGFDIDQNISCTRRECPPVVERVVLKAYGYAVPVDVVVNEPETPQSRARQAVWEMAADFIRRRGCPLSNGAMIYGDALFYLEKACIASMFVKLGSALDLLRAGGAISGPFDYGIEVASTDMEHYCPMDFEGWLPVVVPGRASDACLSAMGYLLLTDAYRYHDRSERALLRDAFSYPGGTRRLVFVFDAEPIRFIDVGGAAINRSGLINVKRRMADAGFGDLLAIASNAGSLLNICYGTPADVDAPDPTYDQTVVAEPRSDFLLANGVRDNYDPGATDLVSCNGALLAMPKFFGEDYASAFDDVSARIRQLVEATPAGSVPMNAAFELGHLVPAQLGAWNDFELSYAPSRMLALRCSSANWFDYLVLTVNPPKDFGLKLSWAAVVGSAGVNRDECNVPKVCARLWRPLVATHSQPRLMHSLKLDTGYWVPSFSPAHAAMAFAHQIVGKGLVVSAIPSLDYRSEQEVDLHARRSFLLEHSTFVFHAADHHDVTARKLSLNRLFLTG